MQANELNFILNVIFDIFTIEANEVELNRISKMILKREFPNNINYLTYIIDEAFGDNLIDKRTKNRNRATTVAIKIANKFNFTDDNELGSMSPRDYIASAYFNKLTQNKLAVNPDCENCGNKATKIFLKTWKKRGFEELDDVISACPSCRLVNGQLIGKKDIRTLVIDEINKDDSLKKLIKEAVQEIIRKEALLLLRDKK